MRSLAPPLSASEDSGAEHALWRIASGGVQSQSILHRRQHKLLKVGFPFNGVEYGVERLFAERTLRFVFGPLVDAAETELVQAAVQRRHVIESVEADGAFGIWRRIG